MSFLWSLGSFLIVIGVLVSVHEYGHFWAARKCGIKVHRFSIGFGKVLWSRVDKHGTEFAVSVIPLGGYVKMLDERNEEVPENLKSQAFNNKSVLQRAFVIAAGPIANFLFAILAYLMVYSIGIPSVKPVIAEITPHSLAEKAGIEPYSQIMAIDDTSTPDWESINMVLATKMGDEQVTLTLLAPSATNFEQKRVLDLSEWRFEPEQETAFGALGIVPVRTKIELTLSKVADNSPAQQAGLLVGDQIYYQNEPMKWRDFIDFVNKGNSFDVQVLRNGEFFNKVITPTLNEKGKWFVGVAPTVHPLSDEYRTELKYGFFDAFIKGVEKTYQLSKLTIQVIGKLFTGDLSAKNLSGPISIAKGAGASSEIGFVYYLSFMALISVNLGIMNLFPLPVLDGGHLLFLAIEAIKGKPLSEQMQNIAYKIGAGLLLILTIFVLFNDFLRL